MTASEFWAAYDAGDPLAHAAATISLTLQLGFTETEWLPVGPPDRYLQETP